MRISSNVTLFYKFFLPTFWIVFGGACTITTWVIPIRILPGVSAELFRWIFTALYFLVNVFFYFRTMRLKRVELDQEYVYISTYFKNYRYPHQDIEQIEEIIRPLFSGGYVHLKSAGSLGQKIPYVPVKGRLDIFLEEHPGVTLEVVSNS